MNGNVAIVGVGFSELGRDTGRTEGDLAVEACRAAIADSGLSSADIDGISMFPYRSSPPNAFSGPNLSYVQRSLGIPRLRWWQATTAENGQLGAMLISISAIAAGLCDHVVCYRAHLRQQRRYLPTRTDVGTLYDEDAHTVPYGAGGGSARGALWAAKFMIETGLTQRQLGLVNVNGRHHAVTNPHAAWKTPTTIEEYLDSRWICAPLKVLDCDYPIDGATAVVFSRAEAVAQPDRAVFVEGAATGPGPDTTWVGYRDKSRGAAFYAGRELWGRTKLRPTDLDVAQLYDGFSVFTAAWLEDLEIVPRGGAGRFLEEQATRLDGALPFNTDGGQLGVGRLHGFGKVAEAVLQVRGDACNQVADVQVAVAAAGGGPGSTAMLLTKERMGAR